MNWPWKCQEVCQKCDPSFYGNRPLRQTRLYHQYLARTMLSSYFLSQAIWIAPHVCNQPVTILYQMRQEAQVGSAAEGRREGMESPLDIRPQKPVPYSVLLPFCGASHNSNLMTEAAMANSLRLTLRRQVLWRGG
eukprot:1832129-Amphidinium_carterae.1